jgi:acyl-CoA reductase-like NAD-dependent aldehyde dehydrogenase
VSDSVRTYSPIDGRLVDERPLASDTEIASVIERAQRAQAGWRRRALRDRIARCRAMVDAFVAMQADVAGEITLQIGRPIAHSPSEVRGFEERARHMIAIAEESLADIAPAPRPGTLRFIRREPFGVVLTLAPWNYPLLTAVNSIVPALLAGNTVILRHSHQTPLCADHIAHAFAQADLPPGVFQLLFASHAATEALLSRPGVDFVAFTGSVAGGRAVQRAARERFIGIGLELGGKDPAYVRADADLAHAARELVDGAFYNAGQSCCGIERIYVHRDVLGAFLDVYVAGVRALRLGNPLASDTTLGPLVRTAAADFVRGQIEEAVAAGARAHIDAASFPANAPGSPYLAPQVLTDVDHSMRVMTEESFGPVVGIMPVESDEEAIERMNDSAYGLTASVWTSDQDAALRIGDRVETGTWFMNRCDYLDPALAWTGVKDSGRGCTLSRVGYEHLTRPKSYHLVL